MFYLMFWYPPATFRDQWIKETSRFPQERLFKAEKTFYIFISDLSWIDFHHKHAGNDILFPPAPPHQTHGQRHKGCPSLNEDVINVYRKTRQTTLRFLSFVDLNHLLLFFLLFRQRSTYFELHLSPIVFNTLWSRRLTKFAVWISVIVRR